jgi:hypothetical protein
VAARYGAKANHDACFIPYAYNTHRPSGPRLCPLLYQRLVLVVEVRVADRLLRRLQQLVGVHARKLYDAVLGQELCVKEVMGWWV